MTLFMRLLMRGSSSEALRISSIPTGASPKTIFTYSRMDRHSSGDGCWSTSGALDMRLHTPSDGGCTSVSIDTTSGRPTNAEVEVVCYRMACTRC